MSRSTHRVAHFHRTVRNIINSAGILRLTEAFSCFVETNGGVLVCFLLL